MDKQLFNDLVMVYKCLKNITPGYLHGRFHHSAKTNQRDTRQNNVCNVCMYVCMYVIGTPFINKCKNVTQKNMKIKMKTYTPNPK